MSRKSEKLYNGITNIDVDLIEKAEAAPALVGKRPPALRKWVVLAASLVLIFTLTMTGVTVAVAAGVPFAYDILYSIRPELALKLTPVQQSCTDNNVEMTVEAVSIHNESADIYISMKDLSGDKIDKSIDLFDSYDINTSFDQIGGCSLIGYDNNTHTATFLIQVQQMRNEPISGEKMLFSVSRFLSGKNELIVELPQIVLSDIPVPTETQNGSALDFRGSGGAYEDSDLQTGDFLVPGESIYRTDDGSVSVTGYGLVNDQLHIQVYYADILQYDNHGDIHLQDEHGNEILCNSNIAFWDSERIGSYEEYIFNAPSGIDLSRYTVIGHFTTCGNIYEGNWKVVFPLEKLGLTMEL